MRRTSAGLSIRKSYNYYAPSYNYKRYNYNTSDYSVRDNVVKKNEKNPKKEPDPGRTELHAAAELNDLPLVKKLLSQGADINANDRLQLTPLHLAAKSNVEESHFELIKFLLKKGASVNAKDEERRTPIFYLVENCTARMVQLFLDFKAKIHVKSCHNESLLFTAVRNTENVEVVQQLIDLGLSVNHHDKYNKTPLLELLESEKDYEKYLKMIELLLDNGAKINSGKHGKLPVDYILEKGNLEMLLLFLEYNAKIPARCYSGGNPFHIVVNRADGYDFLRPLVDLGVDINDQDNDGNSPLLRAVKKNEDLSHFEIIEFLLKNGANVNLKDKDGLPPLWYLVWDGHPKIVELFLNFKPDLDLVDKRGFNFLFRAIIQNYKNLEVLQLLINQGLNVNHQSKEATTPLHEAASRNRGESHLKVAEILLKNQAEVNAVDSKGRTPLSFLVQNCNTQILKFFLSYKADVHVVDNFGRNLLFSAVDNAENEEVVQFLLDQGLNINHRNNKKSSPLHSFCENNESDNSDRLVKFLLRNGANLNAVDSEGLTPLMRAVCRCGETEMLKIVEVIVECTDFNDTENNFNHQCYDSYYFFYKQGFDIITKYLVILKSLDIPIKPDFLDTILLKKKCDGYFKKCLDELSRAKSTKLKNSWITYYDLLVGTRKKLKNYAGNEDLIEDFQESNCEEKFTIYGSKMKENVQRGIKRRELFDKSTILLSDCLPIFNPNHLIIRDIFNCVLSKRDLLRFCN